MREILKSAALLFIRQSIPGGCLKKILLFGKTGAESSLGGVLRVFRKTETEIQGRFMKNFYF